MKSKIYTSILAAALLLGTTLFFSCKKTPSDPPVRSIATGQSVTIQQLRNSYNGLRIPFTTNTILRAVVTCDESSGNLYKQVYIRDYSGAFAATSNYGAISLHFLQSAQGFVNTGDSIAINLNGSVLDKSGGGSLQIDSVIPINQIVHLKSGLNPQPIVVTLPQLNTYSNTAGGGFIYDGQLIQLNNVQFVSSEVGSTYAIPQAPPAAPQNVNKHISDAVFPYRGNTMVTYNSGYSNFANNNIFIPNNSGSVVAVANLYTTMQLTLRSYADINLTNSYVPIVYDTITQNFSCAGLSSKSSVMLSGWTSIAYQGAISWQGTQYGTPFSLYGNPLNWRYSPGASNYRTNDAANDMWLISPPIVDNVYANGGTVTKYIDFSSAAQYATPVKLLSILVTRNFDGTHIIPGDWTDISSAPNSPFNRINQSVAPPNFQYAHNAAYGSVFSPAHVPITISGSSPTFYIAFRYKTNTNVPDSTGSSYFLGNLFLRNN